MFSLRLKSLRESKGVSQSVLAEFLHYSQQSVAKWENGESTPPADVLTLIANYFKVSVDYLLGQDLLVKETVGDYATAQDLVMRLLIHPVMLQHIGYDPEQMSESDLSLFAQDVLTMIMIASKRFDPQN